MRKTILLIREEDVIQLLTTSPDKDFTLRKWENILERKLPLLVYALENKNPTRREKKILNDENYKNFCARMAISRIASKKEAKPLISDSLGVGESATIIDLSPREKHDWAWMYTICEVETLLAQSENFSARFKQSIFSNLIEYALYFVLFLLAAMLAIYDEGAPMIYLLSLGMPLVARLAYSAFKSCECIRELPYRDSGRDLQAFLNIFPPIQMHKMDNWERKQYERSLPYAENTSFSPTPFIFSLKRGAGAFIGEKMVNNDNHENILSILDIESRETVVEEAAKMYAQTESHFQGFK